MQNIFMPSDTIACIEQKYVGKTYRVQGKAYSEPFTKEKIRALFDVYVETMDQVFGNRAIVMQKTRALKGGTIVPSTSYEYVYDNKRSITSYVDDGYYAITINGYRIRDILDSGYHYFTDNMKNARKIICELASILDITEEEVKYVLLDFFCDNKMETFDAFLSSVAAHGKVDVYLFDVCASVVCSFSSPLPCIFDAVDIQIMSRAAQDAGLAVDEYDVTGWKSGRCSGRDKNNFVQFFDTANSASSLDDDDKPDDGDDEEEIGEQDHGCCGCCDPTCDDDHEEFNVPEEKFDLPEDDSDDADSDDDDCLSEIRADVNSEQEHADDNSVEVKYDDAGRDDPKDEVEHDEPKDKYDYYYSYTYVGKDGKAHTKSYFGDEAKKRIQDAEKPEANNEHDMTLKSLLSRLENAEARMERMEQARKRSDMVERRAGDRFNSFSGLGFDELFRGFNELFRGW